MSVHLVHCLKDWFPRVPGGPVAEVDEDRPGQIVVDGEVLRCGSWKYSPRRFVTPGGSDGPYWSEAWIEIDLPMENGACLTIHYPDQEASGASLGIYEPTGWRLLREMDEALINTHRGCIGGHCADPCCGGGGSTLIDEDHDPWSAPRILAAWKRCGTKPVDLTKPEPRVAPTAPAEPRVSDLDRAIASGRTVTLEEYRRLTA